MISIIKIIGPTVLTFFIGIFITPIFTKFFYKYEMWKKTPRTESDTSNAFKEIHNTAHEVSTPRIGGVIIWVSVLITVVLIYALSFVFDTTWSHELNFFSRRETLVPLGAFFLAAIVGLADDLLQIIGHGSYAADHIVYRRVKIVFVSLIGLVIGLWFYNKLDVASLAIPFVQPLFLGIWFVPFFILVTLAVWSTSVVDGLDGLAGGILASIFGAYAFIAFAHGQTDISALCGAIAGGILAFLWFNIPPARFYMGETGMLALTIVLAVIAFLTNSVLILPIIALPLLATSVSVILQIVGYKYFGHRRILKVSPLHHHFQALGWPREKVVMRYWVVSVVCAITGIIIAIVS